MNSNRDLQVRMTAGGRLLGGWASSASPLIIEILADLPFDFVVLDLQHGELDLSSLLPALLAFRSSIAVPMVRMLDHSPSAIGRVLDLGTEFVILPNVHTPEDAARCIEAARYAPEGNRSLGPLRSTHFRSPDGKPRECYAPTVIVQIESEKAIENLDAILEVPHLGGAFVGPHDLSLSLGLAGMDELEPIMRHVVERCRHHGVPLGSMAIQSEDAKRWLDLGVQFVSIMVDLKILRDAALERLSFFDSYRKLPEGASYEPA